MLNHQILAHHKPVSVRILYDKYAGMLLGYIFEVVKDHKLAEEYLISVFCDVSKEFNEVNWEAASHWCLLQRIAKKKLVIFTGNLTYSKTPGAEELLHCKPYSKYLDRLGELERQIFCDVYYHGKSIAEIAMKINKPEDSIRRSLKEAFAKMRNGVEN